MADHLSVHPDLVATLDWRLKAGSHRFPGPDGGTCVNEAAIVAAGFVYRQVKAVSDLPPCFSPVAGVYAINLNDHMPDDLRQELLLPFVTRLAGTARGSDMEQARGDHLVLATAKRLVQPALRSYGLTERADILRSATTRMEVLGACDGAASRSVMWLSSCSAVLDPAKLPAFCARAAQAAGREVREIGASGAWRIAAEILDELVEMAPAARAVPLSDAAKNLALMRRAGATAAILSKAA